MKHSLLAAFLLSGWMHEVEMFQFDSDRMWFDVSSSTFRYCGMWTKFCLINAAIVIGEKIMGNTICALGDAAATPVESFIKHFRDEFEYYIQNGKSMVEEQHNLVEEEASV